MGKQHGITKEEHKRRVGLLLRFLFNFKYATFIEIQRFCIERIGLSFARMLLHSCMRKGYIAILQSRISTKKIYYLTAKGKTLINEVEILSGHYKFDSRCVGIGGMEHHSLITECYFLIHKYLEIVEWDCEWVSRIGKGKGRKLADGLAVLNTGVKLAVEAERTPKKLSRYKTIVTFYRHDIEKRNKYHGVVFVGEREWLYEKLKAVFALIEKEFCSKFFIFASLDMLKEGKCWYQDKEVLLKDAVKAIAEVKK